VEAVRVPRHVPNGHRACRVGGRAAPPTQTVRQGELQEADEQVDEHPAREVEGGGGGPRSRIVIYKKVQDVCRTV